MSGELASRAIRKMRDSTTVNVTSDRRLSDVVDLSDLVRHAAIMATPWLHTLWEKRAIRADIRTDLGAGCFVRDKESHIFQLVLHLIRHAGWVVESTGLITLSTHVDDGKAVLRVSHTGRRVFTEHMNRIVAFFFTTNGHASARNGVATTHAPVPDNERSIRVETAPHLVTTVTVALSCWHHPEGGEHSAAT